MRTQPQGPESQGLELIRALPFLVSAPSEKSVFVLSYRGWEGSKGFPPTPTDTEALSPGGELPLGLVISRQPGAFRHSETRASGKLMLGLRAGISSPTLGGPQGLHTSPLLMSGGGLGAAFWCHRSKRSACGKLCVESATLTFHLKTRKPSQQGCPAHLQGWVWPAVLGPSPTHWPLPTSPSPMGWVGSPGRIRRSPATFVQGTEDWRWECHHPGHV